MRKVIVSEWVTLDGVFDADPQYFNEWFMPYDSEARAAYIQKTVLGCGAFLIGSATYNMLAPYWSALNNNEFGLADKMNSAPKYVVSTTLEKADWNNTQRIIKENVIEEIRKIKQAPGDYILIPGSATLVQSLMEADLIDEYRFLVHPIIMGSGKRFFKDGMPTTKMALIRTEPIDLGVSALYYESPKR
jgi:dihydrofolate reductase